MTSFQKISSVRVYNRGIEGNNSAEGRRRFSNDVVSVKPTHVFIYFGLNDTLNEPKFLPLSEFVDNLAWMVKQSRASGIEAILCTIHHVFENPLFERHARESYGSEGPNGKIDRYNNAIQMLAKENAVSIADFAKSSALAGLSKVVSPDGVHLTVKGTQLLAETFQLSLTANIPRAETAVVCLGDSVTYGTGLNGAGTCEGETYPAVLLDLLNNQSK